MKLSLYNTLSKSVQEFTPIHDREVHMYSCGPTVYDHAHIGNLRSFLFPDILQRSLRIICGYRVKWVMNITDIDDKTSETAQLEVQNGILNLVNKPQIQKRMFDC